MAIFKAVIDDDTLLALRDDFKKLREQGTGKQAQITSIVAMASLFYEIEELLTFGVTHANVMNVFKSRGIEVTKTHFAQNLARLRKVFPKKVFLPEIDPQNIAAIGADLSALRSTAQLPATVPKEKPNEKARGKILKTKPKNVMPTATKVLLCGELVFRLASEPDCGVQEVEDALRASLGRGWTVKVLLQFAAGANFGQWAQAPWPEENDGARIRMAHLIANGLVQDSGAFPPAEHIKKLARKFLDRQIKNDERKK